MVTSKEFIDRLTLRMCELAQRRVRTVLESRTLREALNCRIEKGTARRAVGRLAVPHYWAVYYHGGRGPVRAKKGRLLAFFRSIEDDPRVRPGTASPRRHARTKRLNLSPETFRRLIKQGKLIVTDRVGPAAPNPFFNSLSDFSATAGRLARRDFSRFVRRQLRDNDLLRAEVRQFVILGGRRR